MTSKIFMDLLNSLGLLGLFLILGTFLRAKIKFFQTTFIPASVIGGFLLLILGPICFNIIKIPEEWLKIFSLIPGILIVPIYEKYFTFGFYWNCYFYATICSWFFCTIYFFKL